MTSKPHTRRSGASPPGPGPCYRARAVWSIPFPGEPPEAFAAFSAWLVDPRRTHPRPWARDRGLDGVTVEGWARVYAWTNRAAAYRTELDQEAARLALDLANARVRLKRDLVRASVAKGVIARARLEHVALEALAAPGALEVSARDAAALARSAREEMAALDPPSGEAVASARDLSHFTDEELEALERLEALAARGPAARG